MKTLIIAIVTLLLSLSTSWGQQPVILEALKNDPSYSGLLKEYLSLSAKEDDLELKLSDARALFAGGDTSENTKRTIVTIEEELFVLRNRMEEVGGKLFAAEQEWLRNNPNADVSGQEYYISNPNIVLNPVFRNNLSAKDYSALLQLQEAESNVATLFDSLYVSYMDIARLDSIYLSAGKGEADSIYAVLNGKIDDSRQFADDIAETWNNVFDNKVYLYNWILDKNNLIQVMTDMELQMTNVRLRMNEAKGQYMYDAAAFYPFQKALLLRYESGFATRENYKAAADSLQAAAMKVLTRDRYSLPIIKPEERQFMDLSDIAQSKSPKYTTQNPIPSTEIFSRGTIYRVLLGFYARTQPVSIFKNIYPLSVEKKEDNKYYYYAGGFSSFGEADEAAKKAKKLGISNPRVVQWSNGEYIGVVTTDNHGAKANPGKEISYRVEVVTDGSLPEAVREYITANAPGKEISRIVDTASGEVKFTIGPFDDNKTAEKIARELKSLTPDLNINIFFIP